MTAFISSIIFWNKIKNTYWRWFSVYLLFIVVSEFLGWYLSVQNERNLNLALYNYLVVPTEFIFFHLLFFWSFKQTKLRRLPIIGMSIYLLSWLIDISIHSNEETIFYSSSYTIGNLLLLVMVLTFFIQLVTTNAILTFRNNMLFWVSLGILTYYLGAFPYYGLRNIITKHFMELFNSYTYVVYVLDIFMYLMFTISFIWGKPNLVSSSS